MSTLVPSVTIAFLAALVIPLIVTTLARRGDRRRGPAALEPDAVTGVLFSVRPRRWQHVVIRVLGILFLVVGGFFALAVVVVESDADGAPMETGAVVTPFVILAAGAALLVLASSMARTRMDVLPDRMVVRRGFRAERVVPLTEIAEIAPLANQYGGIQARGADRSRLFYSMGLDLHHADLLEHLQRRRPDLLAPPHEAPPQQEWAPPAPPGPA